MENLKTNIEYVLHLLDEADILCLQEHWMYNYEEPLINELLPNLHYNMKCTDDNDPITPCMKPRGKGGVITIWKPTVDKLITPLNDGSTRCVLVKVENHPKPIYIVNTYMPTDGSPDSYPEALDQVYEINKKYGDHGEIIWVGDTNASIHRQTPSPNDKLFRKFCKEIDFIPANDCNVPTYHHFVGNITSCIDHILTHRDATIIKEVTTKCRHTLNLSSHDPVIANIRACQQVRKRQDVAVTTEARKRPNWKKVDIQQYKDVTDQRLQCLLNHDGLNLPAEVLVDRLYNIMLTSADECGPPVKSRKKKRTTKYPWASKMKPIVN